MTRDEIAAERERFEDLFHSRHQYEQFDANGMTRWDHAKDGWNARAEIARAEQAELRAENERLRERVKELATGYLRTLLALVIDREVTTETKVWLALHPVTNVPGSIADTLLRLAEEAGVWFDDDGNEVPLAEWRARMGGAG